MGEAPVSLRELSNELGLPEPEQAILNDALDHLVNEWPLEREVLCQALLDALDAIPRAEANEWLHRLLSEDQMRHREAIRAECAERERDALRADNDRLREALQRHREDMRGIARQGAGGWTRHINIANQRLWAALSADSDAEVSADG